MPATQNTINLIRTKTSSSPQIEAIEGSLRKTRYILLIGFLCASVITGMVYWLFNLQLANQRTVQTDLVGRINDLKTREGYLLAIKDRTKTVEKVMGNQKPWSQMLDLVWTFAKPPALVSIAVDEQNKIVLTIRSYSLEEVLGIIEAISNYVSSGKIKTPQLLSFQLGKEGQLEISISFYATFEHI